MKNGRRKERRTARRFQVTWEVTVTGIDFREGGRLVNLSSTGAFFHSERLDAGWARAFRKSAGRARSYLRKQPDLEAALEIEIILPFKSKNRMKYTATVVRVEDTATGASVAVKFDNVRPAFAEG